MLVRAMRFINKQTVSGGYSPDVLVISTSSSEITTLQTITLKVLRVPERSIKGSLNYSYANGLQFNADRFRFRRRNAVRNDVFRAIKYDK